MSKIILEALQKHNYVSTACDLAGISEATFYNWLDKAEAYLTRKLKGEVIEEEGDKYSLFLDAVKQARAGSEGELLLRIDTAGSVPTLIEKRTIEHTLKDGSNKTETIERWKPPDWTANAWILERTKWEKYGQHSSLDIQQQGVVFIERLQKARQAQVVDGEYREIEEIAKQPTVEEVAPTALIAAPSKASTRANEYNEEHTQTPRRRPILELIATKKRAGAASTSQNKTMCEPGHVANLAISDMTADQAGVPSSDKKPGGGERC